jgi:hypothetical protein
MCPVSRLPRLWRRRAGWQCYGVGVSEYPHIGVRRYFLSWPTPIVLVLLLAVILVLPQPCLSTDCERPESALSALTLLLWIGFYVLLIAWCFGMVLRGLARTIRRRRRP